MAQATETFQAGVEQATVVIEIDLSNVWLISGNFSGTIPSGQTGFINGNVNLTGDLIVEGFLTGIDTFTLTGNGFQLLAQNGGQINLQGVEKTAWTEWGAPVIGWQVGDLLAVAPTVSSTVVASRVWPGSWAGLTRPTTSPDVTLRPDADGNVRVMKPEVINLSQTAKLQNLRRIHFHDGAGVASLKWLKVLNSGLTDVLGDYPIHFHRNGDASSGSLLDGVVVEGGKNHAFVPHGSNGITFKDCVAYKTARHAYWWDTLDSPGYVGGGADLSFNINYDHSLAMVVNANQPFGSGFRLAGGENNRMVGCRSVLVRFGTDVTGVHWRHDEGVWEFRDFVSHNNGGFGLSVWQNGNTFHLVEDIVGYQNVIDVDHGAYGNLYHYKNAVGNKFRLHAKTEEGPAPLLLEDLSYDVFEVTKHSLGRFLPMTIKNSTFGSVVYTEYEGHPSWIQYRDCGLQPSNFTFTQIRPDTIIELFESGVLTHRWATGGWT